MRKQLFSCALMMTMLLSACAPPCAQQCQSNCLDLRNQLARHLRQQQIKVADMIGYSVVVIQSDGLFNQKSTQLTQRGERKLNAVIAYLRTYHRGSFVVNAYTDKTLPHDLRSQFSQRQARLVAGYLWTNNIPAGYQQLNYYAKAGANAVGNNNNYWGTRSNRRIEIFIDPHCKKSGKGYVK